MEVSNNVGQALAKPYESYPPHNNGVSVGSLFNKDDCKREAKRHLSATDPRVSADTGKQRGFPPPIPLLARMEHSKLRKLWIPQRHYANDGRFILTMVKNRHAYFRANRCDGRLTLNLVSVEVSDTAGEEN